MKSKLLGRKMLCYITINYNRLKISQPNLLHLSLGQLEFLFFLGRGFRSDHNNCDMVGLYGGLPNSFLKSIIKQFVQLWEV